MESDREKKKEKACARSGLLGLAKLSRELMAAIVTVMEPEGVLD